MPPFIVTANGKPRAFVPIPGAIIYTADSFTPPICVPPLRKNEKDNQPGTAAILQQHLFKDATPENRVEIKFLATIVAQSVEDANAALKYLEFQHPLKATTPFKAYESLHAIIVAAEHVNPLPDHFIKRNIIMSQIEPGVPYEINSVYFTKDTNPHGDQQQQIDIAFLFCTCKTEQRALLSAALECATNTCTCKSCDKTHPHIIINGPRPITDPQDLLDVNVDMLDITPAPTEDTADALQNMAKQLTQLGKTVETQNELNAIKIGAQAIQINVLENRIQETEDRLKQAQRERDENQKIIDTLREELQCIHKSYGDWLSAAPRPQAKRKSTTEHKGRTSPVP